MSLFDKYVQVSTISNQRTLVNQNNALLDAAFEQNQNLRQLQSQMDLANRQQQQILQYQRQQHASAMHQKFLKDAVFTASQAISYIEKIKEPLVRFAVMIGCNQSLQDLLLQATRELEEIHDKSAAATMTEKLQQIQSALQAVSSKFDESEIAKFYEAKRGYEAESAPILQILNEKRPQEPELTGSLKKTLKIQEVKAFNEKSIKEKIDIVAGRLPTVKSIVMKQSLFLLPLAFPVFTFAAMFSPKIGAYLGAHDDVTILLIVLAVLGAALPLVALIVLIVKIARRSSAQKYQAALAGFEKAAENSETQQKEAESKLLLISKKYNYQKIGEAMLKKYPDILEQVATPNKMISELFGRWELDE